MSVRGHIQKVTSHPRTLRSPDKEGPGTRHQAGAKRLGTRLRELRTERGLSQDEAAEIMGVHPKSMPRLEGGSTNPTVATLVAAAVAFKIPLRDLFPETGEEDTGK